MYKTRGKNFRKMLTNRTDVGKRLEILGNYITEQLQKRRNKELIIC
jgi:hypothetical protein